MRVSGPLAPRTVMSLTGRDVAVKVPSLRVLKSKLDEPIDEALVVRFASEASFTGEDIVEYQCHGSPAVMDRLSEELQSIGCRLAEPGEFTQRAFFNGRLDLAQVEGLSDLILAETEMQRAQALSSMQGALSIRTVEWRQYLIRAMALCAATIDFADEDVPVDVRPEVEVILGDLILQLRQEAEGLAFAERVRSGFEVVLIGAPNVGKSTLLNALAGRDAAITSEIAGTTRDFVEVQMDLSGLPVTFVDTAGFRSDTGEIEQIGVARSKARAEAADLRVFLGQDADEFVVIQPDDIRVTPKIDLTGQATQSTIGVSGKTGEGLKTLLRDIERRLRDRAVPGTVATHARHGEILRQAINAIEEAMALLETLGENPELITAALQKAAQSLSALIGDVDVEHILDDVFSQFCLGK
ncbi:MAG: tRNA uridine-5-carboxymethylaminomethyl(34) synthesis GTPase MnmE, partial [Pseudomonadota bacterium]